MMNDKLLKIYFSASVSAGRQLVETYRQIVNHLKRYGDVLTEHIGDPDYAKSGFSEPKFVFKTDREWLETCDIVIAEVTVPSTGVGYELGTAEMLKKPVFCLYDCKKTQKITAMLEGNPYFHCIPYDSVEYCLQAIDNIFQMRK